MSSHVPDKGEQMVRYYGYYSNVSRGERKKQNQDEWIPCILEPEGSSKEYRKNCARLIQKIYEEPFGLYFCFDPEVGRVLLEEMHLVQVDSQFNLLMHPDDRLSIHDCHQIVLARCHNCQSSLKRSPEQLWPYTLSSYFVQQSYITVRRKHTSTCLVDRV